MTTQARKPNGLLDVLFAPLTDKQRKSGNGWVIPLTTEDYDEVRRALTLLDRVESGEVFMCERKIGGMEGQHTTKYYYYQPIEIKEDKV